ncbi:winged helix-turn-helix domain-containing protein [Reyranella sp.]|uniref:winged helix-turn-helix domain-containing protein n=1 Tax=Reyranella sp. TaxID=1929291 RepID=UPI00120D3066|nr:winged helix-turn-helix domain-containing protein [Reyranella sp.]TAJ84751.1 MAG: tetratricopeptide repeat protein [Reyranella sp.]
MVKIWRGQCISAVMLIYVFGPFALHPAERRLTRAGRRIAVPGKALQILLLLAEAGGRLVPHETFRTRLWPNIVVEDRTLTVHMSTLRKALGADPADIIETVAGAGYRLSVPVRALSRADQPPRDAGEPQMAGAMPLAVQAFSTGDLAEADTYLGIGIPDAVGTMLGSLPGLAVSSVGAVDDLAGARTLGLAHMLEGAVRREAEKLHVSARLVDVESGRTQRSERFEQSQVNGVALQDAIATWVATSLPQLLPMEQGLRSYRPRTAEAYFLQLQARAHLMPFTRLPLLKALGLFEQALVLDPDYAMAHAGLASTYLLMASTAMLRPLPVDEAMPMARRAAERALALDEGLAEAWAALGRVKMEYDWDWDGAEADLAHAVALNASSVEALATFGQFLSAMGRHDEAIETMEQARRLDPRRVETLQHLGIVYWMAGEGEQALDVVRDSLALAPDSVRGHYGRMMILDQLGRRDEAMAERLKTLKGLSVAQGLADHLEEVVASQGWREAMLLWIAILERTGRWEGAAMQWMAVGEPARALDALEHCVNARTTYLCFVGQNPYFRPLYGNPRFQRILRTLRLDGRTGTVAS